MSAPAAVHGVLRRLGVDIVRYPGTATPLGRRARLLAHHGIDLVLDVGANIGQYALQLRQTGYSGRIVSFEPLPDAYAKLARRAARDPAWDVANVALGRSTGEAVLHRAANSVSSSFLPMLRTHLDAAPRSGYVGDLSVPMQQLDELFEQYVRPDNRVLLKIDAQGYEAEVLAGAGRSLERIDGLQLELSIVALYEGAPTLVELVAGLAERDFALMGIEPGFADPRTGRLLQADGVFFRAGRSGSGAAA